MDKPREFDFGAGVPFGDIADGAILAGKAGGEEVILVRRGTELFALGALCSHYHAPLAGGIVVGDTVRCPMHHACFSLRSGAALRAPALDAIDRYRVELEGGTVFVREKLAAAPEPKSRPRRKIGSVVIVGGGAAGLYAADALRRHGYQGALTMISADDSPPCDRPNLSKDFLQGNAPPEWMPLRPPQYYAERNIDLRLNTRVAALDAAAKHLTLDGGEQMGFDALLLATGADPVTLAIPGATPQQVHYLRTFADSRAILAKAAGARRVVVLGASFIGLEAAASLRQRGLEVHVVGTDQVPMLRVLGEQAGRFIQALHESRGVRFHLGCSVARVDGRQVTLSDGSCVDADFLVLGIGVRPATALAESAGLAVDHGVLVNEYLQSSAPGIFAAGDIARWPDPYSGQRIRVEHWVVAQRQGQTAALNILGEAQKFTAVPFFWSQHYDLAINYVGHAADWDEALLDGSLQAGDASISYRRGGRLLALATIGRDRQNLDAEHTMESPG